MSLAIQVQRPGGPEVLELRQVDVGLPNPDEVLVEVLAAGVNFLDIYHRSGTYSLPLPFTPGVEGVGRVLAKGDQVAGIVEGDRIAWQGPLGGYAQRALVPAIKAVVVPDQISDEVAAGLMLQGLTAHLLVSSTYELSAGEDVLVHAGAGGVGSLLIQLAKARGARVIATVSTQEKEAVARALGADEVVRYDGVDVAGRVRELTDGAGVSVVYDGVGRATFDGSLNSLKRRGLLALYGASSGPVPPFDPQRLNAAGAVYLTRPAISHYIRSPEDLKWRADELFRLVAEDKLTVRIGGRFRLDEAPDAHEALESRNSSGKLLLIPG